MLQKKHKSYPIARRNMNRPRPISLDDVWRGRVWASRNLRRVDGDLSLLPTPQLVACLRLIILERNRPARPKRVRDWKRGQKSPTNATSPT